MKKFILDRGNLILLIFYTVFAFTSITSIFLAEYNNGLMPTLFAKQILFFIISFFIIFLIQKIELNIIEKIIVFFYISTVASLIYLLIAPESIAPVVKGAKAWFNFVFFTIQPSEFAKISTVALVSLLIKENHFKKFPDIIKLIYLGIIIFIPFILVIKENDAGNGLFFIFIYLILSFIVSNKNKTFLRIYSIVLLILGFIVATALFFPKLLNLLGFKNYQLNRLLSWINPDDFKLDFSYQINLVLDEISKGQLRGTFTKNNQYIDEQFNDFIFSIIAKNFGFIGSFLFIILYLGFLLYILNISKKCEQGNFSYYFSILSVFSLVIPFTINTYSTTAIIPVIGVSLPFISYGGSSLLANSILFAILLKINNTIYKERLADEIEDYNSDYDHNEDYDTEFED